MYPGIFIVFEGLDGSGQSTQAGLLREFLIKKKLPVILTKEPTLNSPAGKKIRRILDGKEKARPQELQNLFAKDRKNHFEKTIIPGLQRGKIVICDRYFFSSFAYGAAEGLNFRQFLKLNKNFLLPDLTIILKVRPEICIKRIQKKGKKRTLFEKRAMLAKVWQNYKKLPGVFDNIRIVDGEKSILAVAGQIKKYITSHQRLSL